MEVSKRRTSGSRQQSASTFSTSSKSVTVVNRKLMEEKENEVRRRNIDKRKALGDRQNLTDYTREDYFESGSYRAENIGKPWRSPNLSRRGIHSSYGGSLRSQSEVNEVVSSTSWQSASCLQSSYDQLDNKAHQEMTRSGRSRFQTTTATTNNSNAVSKEQSRTSQLADGSSSYNFLTYIFPNTNNNASRRRGARTVSMWKATEGSDDLEDRGDRRRRRSSSSRVSSIYGFDNEEASSRVTRSQARKLDSVSKTQSVDVSSVGQQSSSASSRFCSAMSSTLCCWVSTVSTFLSSVVTWISSIFLISWISSCVSSVFYGIQRVTNRAKEITGAPHTLLLPIYTAMWLFRLLCTIPCCICSTIQQRSECLEASSMKSRMTAAAVWVSSRKQRSMMCCLCPLLILLFLLPFFWLLFCDLDPNENPSISGFNSTCVMMTTVYNCVRNGCADAFYFTKTILLTVTKTVVILVGAGGRNASSKEADRSYVPAFDSKSVESLMETVREHSSRLEAQEEELKAQKAVLEDLIARHKLSEETTNSLASQMGKWETNLQSAQSKLSELDVVLQDLVKKREAASELKLKASASSGVDSQQFLQLSEQMSELRSEQQNQGLLLAQLKDVQALVVKLENLIKEQKEWTVVELNKHEESFKALSVSVTSDKDESAAALKALGEKIVTEHERLAAYDSQQQGLQVLVNEMQQRLTAEKEMLETKESTHEKSMATFKAMLDSLELEQKKMSQRLDDQAVSLAESKAAQVSVTSVNQESGTEGCANCLSVIELQRLIDKALALFAADRIARPDFALESAGGSIIGTRCTQTYTDRPAVFSLFGVALFRMSRSPRTVIQPALYPGECWAFRGARGQVVVRLASDVEISAFTLEHIPKSLSPNGRIDSAPRRFVLKGLASEADYVGVVLGEFEYLDNGQPLQTFDIAPPLRVFRYIEMQILSNHGHAEYTCIYRLRVHGKVVADTESESEVR